MQKPKSIPTYPGVYIFRRGSTPLYVGKALNLKKRVSSYFTNAKSLTPKVERMLVEATSLRIIRAASEIEALLKEAELIKKWRPRYNVLMRDDKSYFYVAITKEIFPRIFVTHQPFKERIESREKRLGKGGQRANPRSILYSLPPHYIGPFTDGGALYTTLKLLRRIFPYCTCKETHKRPCLASQIGKCLGICCLRQDAFELKRIGIREQKKLKIRYRRNVKNIQEILNGKKSRLENTLTRLMKSAVRKEQYEKAAIFRDQIFGLEGIFEHRSALRAPQECYPWPMVESALQKTLNIAGPIHRIEGYDISNISGTEATGSMVVFSNGSANKKEYRKFRIKSVSGSNDVAMHQEVIRRRFNHPEWTLPDIIVIDGGKPQLNAVLKVIRSLPPSPYPPKTSNRFDDLKFGRSGKTRFSLSPPFVTALAKREEILFREHGSAIRLKQREPSLLHLFQRIRDESHRFARAYHHELRKQKYRISTK